MRWMEKSSLGIMGPVCSWQCEVSVPGTSELSVLIKEVFLIMVLVHFCTSMCYS